jgi:glutathionylspermidine synthase
MRTETRIVEPKWTAVARERSIIALLLQQTRDPTIEELSETVFSTGPTQVYIARAAEEAT